MKLSSQSFPAMTKRDHRLKLKVKSKIKSKMKTEIKPETKSIRTTQQSIVTWRSRITRQTHHPTIRWTCRRAAHQLTYRTVRLFAIHRPVDRPTTVQRKILSILPPPVELRRFPSRVPIEPKDQLLPITDWTQRQLVTNFDIPITFRPLP